MLAETVERFGERTAVEYLGQTWTYGQLDVLSDKIAQGLLNMGIHKGSKAGIWANDRPDTLFCFLALEKIGAILVMFNTSWTFGEVQARLNEIGAEYLFYDEGCRGLDFVEAVRKKDVTVPGAAVFMGGERWREFVIGGRGGAGGMAKSAVTPGDTDMILFTSGSTGAPRGVLTTHYSRSNNARAQAAMVHADCRDVFLVAIPMFHCFSMSGNILAALSVGACICFPKSRRTDDLLAAVERAGVTILTAVPTLFSALLANPRRKQYNTGTLRTGLVGGAGCSRQLFESVEREFHMELLPSLGQTEATAGITAGRYEDPIELRALSAGYAVEHLKLRIVDLESGQMLPAGKNGELCVWGYTVMEGYYNQPELTALAVDAEGFLHTGDLGYLDKDGRLYLTGRKKELIIRGGENIAPGEIENVLLSDERIAQVKVIGVPDEHFGEEVCACVVRAIMDCASSVRARVDCVSDVRASVDCVSDVRASVDCASSVRASMDIGAPEKCIDGGDSGDGIDVGNLSQADVRQLVGASLAYYKVPKYVVFLEQMPLLGNGKIDSAKLKKQVLTEHLSRLAH